MGDIAHFINTYKPDCLLPKHIYGTEQKGPPCEPFLNMVAGAGFEPTTFGL
jgi:hypothetical protein